jgi:hypothetical protein
MRNFWKVLIYEGKKLLFVPLLYLLVCIALSGINLIGFGNFDGRIEKFIEEEQTALDFFYGFCLLLFVILSYRAFAGRKLYQKVRVKAETVYLARILLSTAIVFLYAILEMIIGSVRVGYLSSAYSYPFVLTLLNKPWYYALCFPCSVIVTVLLAYSVVEFIANALYSRFPVWAKILSLLLVVVIFCVTHATPLVAEDAFTFGSENIFVWKFPVGAMSRNYYLNSFAPSDLTFGAVEYTLAHCMLSWNIYNLPVLLTAIISILLCYFSFAFFSLKFNESYLYKGGKR